MKSQLLHGDCLELMADIPDNHIDLIVIDPPYNIKKADWDKWKTIESYVEWMGLVFLECQRVLKDNGSFYFFHNDFLQIVELQNFLNRNTKFLFKQLIVWDKYTKFKTVQAGGGPMCGILQNNTLRNYYQFTEYILFYTFNNPNIIKPTEIGKDIKRARLEKNMSMIEVAEQGGFYKNVNHGGMVANWESGYSIPSETQYNLLCNILPINNFIKYNIKKEKSSVYTFNNQKTDYTSTVWHCKYAKKEGHITPKPEELIKNIIKYSSNEGDLVLDCFMGSGTTGVACKNLNRNFIGIEKDNKYFEIAKERIENTEEKLKFNSGQNIMDMLG